MSWFQVAVAPASGAAFERYVQADSRLAAFAAAMRQRFKARWNLVGVRSWRASELSADRAADLGLGISRGPLLGLRNRGRRGRRLRICRCPSAERDHRRELRSYAHVGHRRGVLCVARAFYRLPLGHRLGLIVHEVGHLELQGRPHSELQADQAAFRRYGIRVQYRNTRWGRHLQWVDAARVRPLKSPAARSTRP